MDDRTGSGLRHHVTAQDASADLDTDETTWAAACRELREGRKRSHWMWFVFPQVAGLGQSEMARRYAITSLAEARAYLRDPVLGPRLEEAAGAILAAPADRDAVAILGETDARKLHASMTLFLRADPDRATFRAVLDRFHGGEPDPATDRILAAEAPGA
ncbi:MAG: DUF1810 domain-containing protein [Chloroflexota bacterium]